MFNFSEKRISSEANKKFISWRTADTFESIPIDGNGIKETFPVFFLCPDGTVIEEKNYQGDAVFGGRNALEMLAEWNCPEQCSDDYRTNQNIGLDMLFNTPNKISKPIKIIRKPTKNYEQQRTSSEICHFQGCFYDEANIIAKTLIDIIDDYLYEEIRNTLQSSICVDKKIEHMFTTERVDQVITALFSNLRSKPCCK